MSKTAIITGITGQDGSHLADFLLEKNYQVVGMVRRVSTEPPSRVSEHLWKEVEQFSGDLLDSVSIERAIKKYQPDEFYNLAAQSHVGMSWKQPELTSKINYFGVSNCLKAIQVIKSDTKFYQASTSEMFGKVVDESQNEESRFYPQSPYAIAKLAAHWLTINYRQSYDMFTVAGILFNHEGPRRGLNFVTHKISHYAARYKLGLTDKPLQLGNLNAKRDWGYAPDYVRAMWMMLQQDKPNNYVVGTGETHSVRDFVNAAFKAINVELVWSGEGVDEIAKGKETDEVIVEVNPEFFRPADVEVLKADPTKIKKELGWEPEVTFEKLVEIMVKHDFDSLKRD